MAYAFKCFFSEETARPVRAIWDELAARGLATFLKESCSTPGITLGIFDEENEEGLAAFAKAFSREVPCLKVETWGLGGFPTKPAYVFLGVVQSEELTALHSRFVAAAKATGKKLNELYDEGKWVPHSTLAIRCEPSKIPEIMDCCLKFDTRIVAKVDSVALVEIGTAREVFRTSLQKTLTGPAVALSMN